MGQVRRVLWAFLVVVGMVFGMVGTALASRTVPVPAAASVGAVEANSNQGAVLLLPAGP